MSNTQTSDSPNLDREDPATLEQSTRRQWSLIGHLLHLPPVDTLANENQQMVAERIADFMADIRGGIADRANLRDQLHEAYQERLQNIGTVDAANEPVRAATTSLNVSNAEAWLQTIYAHFSEEELRNIVRNLPASILPANRDRRWLTHVNGVDYSIDLTHPIWKTGNRDTIARALEGRTLPQAGITVISGIPIPGYVLTPADVELFLGSTCEVVDPQLSLGQMQLDNQPARGERMIIDLAPMIRLDPRVARCNRDRMINLFETLIPNRFSRYSRRVNMRTGAQLPRITAHADFENIVDALFEQNSRDPNHAFGTREVSLTTAIQNRGPIDRLVSGNATNRELLLALSMIQRDPSAVAVLEAQSNNTTEIRNRLTQNEALLRTAQTVKDLSTMQLPHLTEAEIATHRVAYEGVVDNVLAGSTALNGDPISLYNGLTPAEQAIAGRAGIPATIIRINVPAVPGMGGAPGVPERNNWDQIQKMADKAQNAITKLDESIEKIDKMEAMFQTMIAELEARGVPFATLEQPAYRELRRYLLDPPLPVPPLVAPATGYSAVIDRDRITPRTNTVELSRQFVAALRDGNPANRLIIRDLSHYEKLQETITAELAAAEANTSSSSLTGSEACRAVVERGLSHEGLRGEELKDTAQYMFNSIQRTRESEADLQMYADRQFADGENDHHAEHHWEHGKSFRTFSSLGLRERHFFHDYAHNLQHDVHRFGFDIATPNAVHNFGNHLLPHLIDVYFRTKAMTELDPHDPHHLPSSETVVRFQRQLYMHIVDRAQRSFNRATGMTNEELNAFRAKGMNIDVAQLPAMTIQERMGYIREFMNDTNAYMNVPNNKKNFDRMVQDAYHPIQEIIDRHNRRNPMRYIRGMWNWTGRPLLNAAGIGADSAWKNKKGIAVAALIGTAAVPIPFVGTALGAAYGFFKGLGNGGHGAARGHDAHGGHDDHGDDHGHGH